jgi:hypothetical protein
MSMSFNAAFYLDKYPDVLLGIAQKKVASAEAHWKEFGAAEGRDPNANFDTKAYFLNNGDVLSAGVNPLTHFLEFGAAEGRSPSPTFVTSAKFDTAAYAAANPDLAGAGITTPAALYEHFAKFGFAETRPGVQTTDGVAITDGVAGGTVGATFTLTKDADSPAGTTSADTVTGLVDAATPANSTLTAADNIALGAGNDTLNVTTQGLSAAPVDMLGSALVSDVENISVRAVHTGANAATLDARSAVGLTTLTNNLSTAAVIATNLSDAAAVMINGNGSVVNGATSFGYVAGATSGEVTVNGGVTGGAVAITGAGLTSVALTSSGAANTTGLISNASAATAVTIKADTSLVTGGLTVGTNAAAQSLTISGAATNVAATATAAATGAVVLGTLDTDFATVNASGLTAGGIVAQVSTATQKITGGVGADFIATGAVLTTGSVDAGAGSTDTLTSLNTTHLATKVLGDKYTNFETLSVTNGVTVDLDNIAGITAVEMTDGNAATALNDLSAVQAGAVTIRTGDGAATVGVKGAMTVGQIDTVKMTFNDGNTTLNQDINATASTFTLAGTENLEVTAVDAVEILQSNATSGVLNSVKLFGAGNISFTTGDMDQENFSLDASASTGTNTLSAAAFATLGVNIKGGTGNDTITGSGAADVITGGAGVDNITGGAGVDVVNGGAGVDTFTFATGDIDTTLGAVTDEIGDFVTKSDKIATGFGAGTAANYVEATVVAANLAAMLTAADTALAGAVKYYVGQVGTDSYLVTDDNAAGYTDVIKLTGVALTGIEFGDISA